MDTVIRGSRPGSKADSEARIAEARARLDQAAYVFRSVSAMRAFDPGQQDKARMSLRRAEIELAEVIAHHEQWHHHVIEVSTKGKG